MTCLMNDDDLARCQCEGTDSIIHATNSTYYSKMGIVQNKGVLYSAPLKWYGIHFITELLHKIDSNHGKRFRPQFIFIAMQIGKEYEDGVREHSFVVVLKAIRHDMSIQSCLRRIQRTVRKFIRMRREVRFNAINMSQHPRLGSESSLQCLCSDALSVIFQNFPKN